MWPWNEIKSCLIFPNIGQKLPNYCYMKVVLFKISKKVTKIFGLLLWEILLPRRTKNRPIWSHCSRTQPQQRLHHFLFIRRRALILLAAPAMAMAARYSSAAFWLILLRRISCPCRPRYEKMFIRVKRWAVRRTKISWNCGPLAFRLLKYFSPKIKDGELNWSLRTVYKGRF